MQERQVVAVRQSRHPRDLVVADVALGPPAPAPGHLGQAAVFLGRPGLERRPAAQVEHLHIGRLAAVRGDELANQDCLALLDGGRALGELGHQGLGHPGHLETELLGVAASPTVPAPPQLLGQQVAEHALVQLGESHDGLEQAPGIERPPRAVGDRAGAVGHHHVVVELGVPGPRVPVGEGGGHDSFDVFLDHAVGARTRVEHLALGVGEHDLDGAAMAGVDPGLGLPVGQRPGRRTPTWMARRSGRTRRRACGRCLPWPVPRPRCGPSPRPVRCRCGWPGWRQPAPPPAWPGRGACGWAGGRAPCR